MGGRKGPAPMCRRVVGCALPPVVDSLYSVCVCVWTWRGQAEPRLLGSEELMSCGVSHPQYCGSVSAQPCMGGVNPAGPASLCPLSLSIVSLPMP